MLQRHRGQALIQLLGLVIVTIMLGAFAIDTGFYFTVHRGMQNAADAAALAGTAELFKNTNPNLSTRMEAARAAAQAVSRQNMSNELNTGDIEFGYVNPQTGQYLASSFATPSGNAAFNLTGGYNAVRVTVKADTGQANGRIPAIFANYFGLNSFSSEAQAVALYGGGVASAGGLRPVYICQTAWDRAVQLYGDPSIPEITFYGDTLRVGTTNIDQANSCGAMGPGNWGLSDFERNNGAPGNSTVRDWFNNGFSGNVHVGEDYEVQTGTPINTYDDALNTLRNNQTVVYFPMYDQASVDGGSNQLFRVSMIVPFVITDFRTTGNQSQRYIRGYFRKSICTRNCSYDNTIRAGTVTRLRLVH